MKPPEKSRQPPAPPASSSGAEGVPAEDRAEIDQEWRRIEAERLAAELAEAREDSADSPALLPGPAGHPFGRWLVPIMAGALVAGGLLALLLNLPGQHSADAPSAGGKQTALQPGGGAGTAPNDGSQAGSAGLSLTRSAAAPPGGVRVRVLLENPQGRQRLEDLLAESPVAIDFDEEGADGSERLRGRGTHEAIDALLDALAIPNPSVTLTELPADATLPPAPPAAPVQPTGVFWMEILEAPRDPQP
jgi:hypothetical protein